MNERRKLRQRNFSDDDGFERGKIPPQAIDLEELVLGAIMLEKDTREDVMAILNPDIFYKESHQTIMIAIIDLHTKREPVDILTVTNQLKNTGELEIVGGPYYITQLTNRISSTANTEYYIRILIQKFLQREVIRISSEKIKLAFEDTTDVFDLIDGGITDFNNLNEKGILNLDVTRLGDISSGVLDIVKKTRDSGFIPGILTKLTSFDKVFYGINPPDLIILAARPGMGKTALMLTVTRNIAISDDPVAIFSLEMNKEQLTQRFFIQEVNISFMDMHKAVDLSNNQMMELDTANHTLNKYPIFIDDTAGISPQTLRAKAQKLKHEHGIKLIIIDYLQLMNADAGYKNGQREQEISSISRALKAIAKDLNLPIIALAQLSRAVETRGGDKRPLLSDLRESGAIEQDADAVLFLYRPYYYKIEVDSDGNSCKETAEVIIAKHRNGGTGTTLIRFLSRRMKFVNFEDPEEDNFNLNTTCTLQEFNLEPNIDFDKSEDDVPF